jgi:CrcB protein
MMLRRASLVFLGGGLGACARALLISAFAAWNAPFPLIVLAINLLGSGLLGTVYAFADQVGRLRAETRLLVAVGLLGGFTTFSTFGWGVVQLAGRSAPQATLYAAVSVAGAVPAAVMGLVLGRKLVVLLERAAREVLIRTGDAAPRPERSAAGVRSTESEDREETA